MLFQIMDLKIIPKYIPLSYNFILSGIIHKHTEKNTTTFIYNTCNLPQSLHLSQVTQSMTRVIFLKCSRNSTFNAWKKSYVSELFSKNLN